jgi:imidazoleglycerol-phosphate dehydratase
MYGKNTHHIIECVFKAFARALKGAVKIEGDKIPSSKGIL